MVSVLGGLLWHLWQYDERGEPGGGLCGVHGTKGIQGALKGGSGVEGL